jgi:tRNA (guanine37-N1)-methyltransferase
MRFDVITIFPQALGGLFSSGVVGQACEAGDLAVHIHDLRDFTDDAHRVVDDRPYGGGAGMLLKLEPFVRALEALRPAWGPRTKTVLLSAQGRLFSQKDAAVRAKNDGLVLLCGRYEGRQRISQRRRGLDRRLRARRRKAAAAVVIEATARMLPACGKYESVATDCSTTDRGSERLQYTAARPRARARFSCRVMREDRRVETARRVEEGREPPDLLGLVRAPACARLGRA